MLEGKIKNIKVEIAGREFEVPVPEAKVRIVGFTVEPKSIPRGFAC